MGSKPIMCIAHYLHSVTLYKELLYLSINTIIFNVQCIVYRANKQLCIVQHLMDMIKQHKYYLIEDQIHQQLIE